MECPLKGWETAKLTISRLKGADLKPVMGIILEMVSTYVMGPIATALINVIQTGTNLLDAVTEAVSDLINSISPTDWLLYALSVNAKEISDVAKRERDLLMSIKGLMRQAESKNRSGNTKFRRFSKAAMANVERMITSLKKASNCELEYREINTSFRIAYTLSESNLSLLSQNASEYMKKQRLAKTAVDISEKIKTAGPIKAIDNFTQSTYNLMSATASGIIRNQLVDDMATLLDKYMAIARIIYMYGGIDYTAVVILLKKRYVSIIDKIHSASRPSGDEEAWVINPAEEKDVDEALTKLGTDIVNLAKEISTDVATNWQFLMLSMRPDYQIGTRLWNDLTDLYGTVFSDDIPPAAQPPVDGVIPVPSPTVVTDSAILKDKNNALESLMNVSPYSTTPASSLTVFGAGLKMPALIEMYNLVGTMLKKNIGADKANSTPTGANDISKESKNKICAKAKSSLKTISMTDYEFDSAIGMAKARLSAMSIRNTLRHTERTTITGIEQSVNNETYLRNMIKSHPLSLQIHEPAMSLTVVLGFIVPAALFPFKVNKQAAQAAIDVIDERIEYLSKTIDAVAPLIGYSDDGCAGVIGQLQDSGLSFVAKAASIGQIATGVVSVSAAIGGSALVLFDIVGACVGQDIDPIKFAKITASITNIKKQAEAVVQMAANAVLGIFSFDLTPINNYLIQLRRENEAIDYIKGLVDRVDAIND